MIFLLAMFLAYALVVWLESNAPMHYGRLLGLRFIFPPFKAFLKEREQGNPATLNEWIMTRYGDTFLGELLTCPKCLAGWLGIIVGFSILSFDPRPRIVEILALPYLILFFYNLNKKLTHG